MLYSIISDDDDDDDSVFKSVKKKFRLQPVLVLCCKYVLSSLEEPLIIVHS